MASSRPIFLLLTREVSSCLSSHCRVGIIFENYRSNGQRYYHFTKSNNKLWEINSTNDTVKSSPETIQQEPRQSIDGTLNSTDQPADYKDKINSSAISAIKFQKTFKWKEVY